MHKIFAFMDVSGPCNKLYLLYHHSDILQVSIVTQKDVVK
jgi:hypothetical protein